MKKKRRSAIFKKAEILRFLKTVLDKKTMRHVLGAAETAIMLAGIYGTDRDKAELAALLHDCAKDMDKEALLEAKRKYGARLGSRALKIPAIWHGIVAEKIALKKFRIRDRQILRAIRMHSTGGSRMGKLEKIIYAADFIEPGRKYDASRRLRKMMRKNITLDFLVAAVIKEKVKYLRHNNMLVHPATKILYTQLKIKR